MRIGSSIPLLFLQLAVAFAQQRPLITERAETLDKGEMLLDAGFEFLQQASFPFSGLEGDLTRSGVMGLRWGVSSNVELQWLGSMQDFLNVERRYAAPGSDQLDFLGNSTSDFGDLTVATKIQMIHEKGARPAFSSRFGMEMPNASNESGLGNDETNIFTEFLIRKTLGPLQLTGNLGMDILGDPVEPGSQDDMLRFGFAAVYSTRSSVNLLAEVYGRAGAGGVGTENRSRVRAGIQLLASGLYWDIAGFWGLAAADPATGLIVGVSKSFNLY